MQVMYKLRGTKMNITPINSNMIMPKAKKIGSKAAKAMALAGMMIVATSCASIPKKTAPIEQPKVELKMPTIKLIDGCKMGDYTFKATDNGVMFKTPSGKSFKYIDERNSNNKEENTTPLLSPSMAGYNIKIGKNTLIVEEK